MKHYNLVISTIFSLILMNFLITPAHAQVVSNFFDSWNTSIGLNSAFTNDASLLGGPINRLIPFLIIIAGVILLIMMIIGGFQMLTAGASPDSAEAGKKRLTTAILGFFVVITAYWLMQILEVIFGVNIL
jgi:hypothetical protein